MAKIIIKPHQELLVTEAKAEQLYNLIESLKLDAVGLYTPVVIEHEDGLWSGTLKDVGPISMTDKKRALFKFNSEEDYTRFHKEYGYGAFEDYLHPTYGLVDVLTQFLIKTKQYDILDDRLIMLPMKKETKDKWMGLWESYKITRDVDIWN